MKRALYHKFFFMLAALVGVTTAQLYAQQGGRPQLNEDYTFNSPSAAPRPLHYAPDGDEVVLVAGTARFNRALYGAHTGFRVECSDSPEFGLYLPGMGGNLLLTLPEGALEVRYGAGLMRYKQGGVSVEVEVLREGDDAALWIIRNEADTPRTVGLRFGGVSGEKFYRNGDLGVDDPTAFELKEHYCATNHYTIDKAHAVVDFRFKEQDRKVTLTLPLDRVAVSELPHLEGEMVLASGEERVVVYRPREAMPLGTEEIAQLKDLARAQREALTSTLRIATPDKWINPIGGALTVAADGLWSGRSWLHGAVGWRTEHLGWRGAYVGSALGWHERARTHFEQYAANQVTDCPPQFDHPRQDSLLNLARAEKQWGTPLYSDGYICRRPGRREMSHYDMNLVYIDALLRHIRATGDVAFMRKIFPTLQRHLAWEKRNFDPDGDHLYDAYCCIWASDALYYNAGAVTHSSAYNYFANLETARIAACIGEDHTPYLDEAQAINEAMIKELWNGRRGHWGEYRDRMGYGRLHSSPALWTIYHTIDSEVGALHHAAASALYAQQKLPHLKVRSTDFAEEYALPSTTDWQPYIWSINNVAIAEVMHTALAYWQVGMKEEAFHLMKGVAMDNMYLGASPLNFGQLSYLDAARGECYRDFGDPIGVWARALVEGLFGIRPDLIRQRVVLRPGFPAAWENASIEWRDLSYRFERVKGVSRYHIENRYGASTKLELQIDGSRVSGVEVNGRKATFEKVMNSYGYPLIRITLSGTDCYEVVVKERVRKIEERGVSVPDAQSVSPVTLFQCVRNGLPFYKYKEQKASSEEAVVQPFTPIEEADSFGVVNFSALYNASVGDIYRNEYLAPRPAYTTLQIPKQGYGDWCHPQAMVEIDDQGLRDTLRTAAKDERMGYLTRGGIPWLLAHTGPNVVYTSLWENYPNRVEIPLELTGRRLLLLMVGSTNHMQSHIANGLVEVTYADGEVATLPLVNPDNWSSVEQLGVDDGGAFRAPALPRLTLRDARFSTSLGRELHLEGVNQMVDGGAAVVVEMPLDSSRLVRSIAIEALSNDVVIGLMGVTVVK